MDIYINIYKKKLFQISSKERDRSAMAPLNMLKGDPIPLWKCSQHFPRISCKGLVSDCKEKEQKDG